VYNFILLHHVGMHGLKKHEHSAVRSISILARQRHGKKAGHGWGLEKGEALWKAELVWVKAECRVLAIFIASGREPSG
jgi:hypothetical protein